MVYIMYTACVSKRKIVYYLYSINIVITVIVVSIYTYIFILQVQQIVIIQFIIKFLNGSFNF